MKAPKHLRPSRIRTVQTPARLHYAPQPPRWFQRRRVQRWIWRGAAGVLAPVIAVAAVAAIRWAHEAWLVHKNRAAVAVCEGYVPPVGQLVFEMSAQRVTALVTAPPW